MATANPKDITLQFNNLPENVIEVDEETNNIDGRTSPASDPGSRSSSPHFFPEGFRRIASRVGNNIFGPPKATLTENQIKNDPLYKLYLNYQEYPTPKKLDKIKKLAANAGFRSNIVKTLRSMAAYKFSNSSYDPSGEQNMRALIHALGTTNLTSGGNRNKQKKTKKTNTQKLTIPPQLAEFGIEIAEAVVVGGKRRKTRKNK
jgi:hypothetical protein